MDLSTKYLGFELPHPLMPGASPLVDDIDTVRRLEDAGASAIVMHSLFEEQIAGEGGGVLKHITSHEESSAEARSFFPDHDDYRLGPEEYLDQIRKIKSSVSVPVIGSLNGTTPGGWLDYAKLIEEAGADALELNLYYLATDPSEDAASIEEESLQVLGMVKRAVKIPVAAKLSPFYTSLAHFARRAEEAGVDGVVLFNRLYQPDIDVEALEVVRTLRLSDPSELLLRIRWLAVLSGRCGVSLAASGGVQNPIDAIKAVMAGAHAVQVVSALLRWGPKYLQTMRREMEDWLEQHEYESLRQAQGSMSLAKCPDPKAYERANYLHILASWHA